jgi:DNA invertase Pin-like site-specific DNA recombinase
VHGPPKAGADTLADHAALKLGKGARDLKHEPPGRRGRVDGKQLGRPKVVPALEKRIQSQLRAGNGLLATAKALGVGTSTVQRVAREMAAARPLNGVSAAAKGRRPATAGS